MDIFSVLKEEHKAVKEIFKQITETTERAEKTRDQLYEELYRALHSHAVVEQKTLYTRLEKEESLKHLMAEAEEEHTQAEKLLTELGKMNKTTIEWTAKATVLMEDIEHHVKEEEGELFHQAKKVLKDGEAEEIGDAFLRQKKDFLARMK